MRSNLSTSGNIAKDISPHPAPSPGLPALAGAWRFSPQFGRLYRIYRWADEPGDRYECAVFDAEGSAPQIKPVDGKHLRMLPDPTPAVFAEIRSKYRHAYARLRADTRHRRANRQPCVKKTLHL